MEIAEALAGKARGVIWLHEIPFTEERSVCESGFGPPRSADSAEMTLAELPCRALHEP